MFSSFFLLYKPRVLKTKKLTISLLTEINHRQLSQSFPLYLPSASKDNNHVSAPSFSLPLRDQQALYLSAISDQDILERNPTLVNGHRTGKAIWTSSIAVHVTLVHSAQRQPLANGAYFPTYFSNLTAEGRF